MSGTVTPSPQTRNQRVVTRVAESFDVDGLYKRLRRALRHGVRASRLLRSSPDLVELLAPTDRFPGQGLHDRAIAAEDLIRRAVDQIGGTAGQALEIILGLAAGTVASRLEDRRRQAGVLLDVQPGTFRRDWREAALIHDLAVEIYRLLRGQS